MPSTESDQMPLSTWNVSKARGSDSAASAASSRQGRRPKGRKVALTLPKRSGIFQAAGLMLFNPAAEWLPTAPSTISLSGQPEGRKQKRQKQVLLDRIVKGMRVKTKLEQTRECTDFQSKESSHAMKMEQPIEHDDSAFDGSPLHRSSHPHIFNVWRECFAHDFNYIPSIPDIQMESLSTLQRILFFDALLLKTTD
ncbi:hypothetical protein BLNAU_25280 [Blattamonas nauphoetae]|uniref:Uncharacterized protein n=2 Tax=Blattamonas nauphoetae TaxID=2049346 RepID=A0ABQ9WK19_9EUKA|nr:hypothetical protein BLNAU_25280 [Blattamonas nauphoetae]